MIHPFKPEVDKDVKFAMPSDNRRGLERYTCSMFGGVNEELL
jgi:hypothetical protein